MQSFSQKGYPYDNVCIESFHSILKKEEIRAYQNYSGTAVVDASVPAIGFYKIFIPYRYTVVTSGGAPYFSNARAEDSYAGGF